MAEEKLHLLHGAIGCHDDWVAVSEYLQSKHLVTESHNLYDYLLDDDCSFAHFTRSFIDDLSKLEKNQKSQHLLGYSLGGRLALHALLAAPSMWSKAVIVSAHTGIPVTNRKEREARIKSDLEWSEMATDKSIPWSKFLSKWNQQSVLQNHSTHPTNTSDRMLLEAARDEIARSFTSWSLGLQDDLLEKMSSLTVPILWVVGEDDKKFLRIAVKATEILPNAELRIVKNAGHRVPWEQAEEFHSLVCEWFSD